MRVWFIIKQTLPWEHKYGEKDKIDKQKILSGERIRLGVHQALFISYIIKCQK